MADKDNSSPDSAGQFLCNLCGARFDTMPALIQHKEQVHDQK